MDDRTCTIDGCDKPLRARGWCGTHWSRWKKHGDPLIAGKRGYPGSPEAEAERRRKIGEAQRGRKLGPPSEETRRKISATLTGRKLTPEQRARATATMRANRDKIAATSRAQWERKRQELGQDAPAYSGCHARVRTARGPAKYQVCVTCEKQARHWAHIHDTDPADPQNYQPMCQPCHYAYDDVSARSKATMGPEGRRAIALKAWETKRRKARDAQGSS